MSRNMIQSESLMISRKQQGASQAVRRNVSSGSALFCVCLCVSVCVSRHTLSATVLAVRGPSRTTA